MQTGELVSNYFQAYLRLARLDKPIGILLLLWPTLWALWLANHHSPPLSLLLIFVAGVMLMRSCGCVVNDLADRHFDGHVKRTRDRPLVTGQLSVLSAILFAIGLGLCAFLLVLSCNDLTVGLALVGALLAFIYPFLKRVTHWPQVGLGLAFAWGVPMAFAASVGEVKGVAWWVFLAAFLWPIIYDTFYAMVDRADDQRVGIKSTAILFAEKDRVVLFMLQFCWMLILIVIGNVFHLRWPYQMSLFVVLGLMSYQQWLIKDREPAQCFAAFKNNHWVGLVIWLGIVWGQAT